MPPSVSSTSSPSTLSGISLPSGARAERPSSSPPAGWWAKRWQQLKRRLSTTTTPFRSQSMPNAPRTPRTTNRRQRHLSASSTTGRWDNYTSAAPCGFAASSDSHGTDSDSGSSSGAHAPESVQRFDIYENTLKTKFRTLRDQWQAQGQLKPEPPKEIVTSQRRLPLTPAAPRPQPRRSLPQARQPAARPPSSGGYSVDPRPATEATGAVLPAGRPPCPSSSDLSTPPKPPRSSLPRSPPASLTEQHPPLLPLSEEDVAWFDIQEVKRSGREVDTATQVSLSSGEHPVKVPTAPRWRRRRRRGRKSDRRPLHLTVYNQAPRNRFIIEPGVFGIAPPCSCPCTQHVVAASAATVTEAVQVTGNTEGFPVDVTKEPAPSEALAYLQESLRSIPAPSAADTVAEEASEVKDVPAIENHSDPTVIDALDLEQPENPPPAERKIRKRPCAARRRRYRPMPKIIYITQAVPRASTSEVVLAAPIMPLESEHGTSHPVVAEAADIQPSMSEVLSAASAVECSTPAPEADCSVLPSASAISVAECDDRPLAITPSASGIAATDSIKNSTVSTSDALILDTEVMPAIAMRMESEGVPVRHVPASLSWESFPGENEPFQPSPMDMQQMLLISNLSHLTSLLNQVTTEIAQKSHPAEIIVKTVVLDKAEQTQELPETPSVYADAQLVDVEEPKKSEILKSQSFINARPRSCKRNIRFVPALNAYHKHRNFHCDDCHRKRSVKDVAGLNGEEANQKVTFPDEKNKPKPQPSRSSETASKHRIKQVTFANELPDPKNAGPARFPPEVLTAKLDLLHIEKGFVTPTPEVLQHFLHLFELNNPDGGNCHPSDARTIWETWKSRLHSIPGASPNLQAGAFAPYAQFTFNRFLHFIKMYCSPPHSPRAADLSRTDLQASMELFQAGVIEIPLNRPKIFTGDFASNRHRLRAYITAHFHADTEGRCRSIFRQKFPLYLHLYKSSRTGNLSDDELNDVKLMLHLFRLDRATLFSKSESKLVDDIMRQWNESNTAKAAKPNILDIHRATQRWLVETAYVNYRQSFGTEEALRVLGAKYLHGTGCVPQVQIPGKGLLPERSPGLPSLEESLQKFRALNQSVWSVCRHAEMGAGERSSMSTQPWPNQAVRHHLQRDQFVMETAKEIWKSATVTTIPVPAIIPTKQFHHLRAHRVTARRETASNQHRSEQDSFGSSTVVETDSSLSIQICTREVCDGLKKTP